MAATDPIKGIKRTYVGAPLPPVLRQLASLPPRTDTPYVTIGLDWRPDGNAPAKRTSVVNAWNDLKVDLQAFPPRSEAHDSLNRDVDRISEYLKSEVDPSAKGVHIVANSGHDVFVTTEIGLPIPTSVHVAPIPALKSLTRLVEDHPLYAILVMDQREATLSFVSSAGQSGAVNVVGSDYPRHQKAGGLSQQRYQTRAEERVEAFTRTVAKEVERALSATGINRLVVSHDEVSGPPFLKALDERTGSAIIGDFRIAVDAPFQEVLAAAQPIAADFERKREAEIVEAVSDAVGAGHRGVAGTSQVLSALRNGQVHELAMVGRYEASGWADYSMSTYGVGSIPSQHPAGGSIDSIVSISLEEEMIRLAIETDALIEIITGRLPVLADEAIPDPGAPALRTESSNHLESLGGVAALLRYEV